MITSISSTHSVQNPAQPSDSMSRTAVASVVPWLGVLFVMLFSLNTVGGWVRLSGSGVAIPHWPFINGSLLPPFSDEAWAQVRADYATHQGLLAQRVKTGELSPINLGREPRDLPEFKVMFMTEYSHRLFAALVGVVGAGCITIVFRRKELRTRIGWPMGVAGVLIITQAFLGAALLDHGTNTHHLFMHQSIAGLVLGCVLWAMLCLLRQAHAAPVITDNRRLLTWLVGTATVLTWMQLMIGALVAGSRNDGVFRHWPIQAASRLWEQPRSLAWNLLDNTEWHQWLHQWTAWGLVLVMVVLYVLAWVRGVPTRMSLALKVSATFLAVQLMLGLANVWTGITPMVSLAHQFMGMCFLMSLVLAWHDVRNEPGIGRDRDRVRA